MDVFKKIQYELEMKIESLEESLLMLSFALGNNLTANDLSLLESKDKNSLKRATSVIEISDMDDYNNLGLL